MVNEDAALLNCPVTQVTPAALFDRRLHLTDAEAVKLLQEMLKHYNSQYGLKWSDFTSYIEEYELGRKMTSPEIRGFVKKNILTIQR